MPPCDTAACDRAVEQLARESWLGSETHRASWTIRSAWTDSHFRRSLLWLTHELTPPAMASAIRVRALTVAVAGTAVLILNATKPRPVVPLSWLVPAAAIVCSLLAFAAADALARAIADRRLRHKVS